NKVWIRGDDQKPWIQAYDLYANQAAAGTYKKAQGIELSNLLDPGNQNFSSSFQVRWGQWGQLNVTDNENAAGYTFDDIRLYRVSNDIQLVSIDTPIVASCGLGNGVPVKITVRNSAGATISAIPVKYQVDDNPVVIETVPSIAGRATIPFSFAATADLSALGSHTIKAWVDLPADTYRSNDTVVLTLYNSPVISSFPYLQNFEAGDGSWHSEGKKNSWKYGTPSSIKINRAASGSKAWKTSLTGNYNDLEKSYLYSPCFDIGSMAKPMLSMSIAIDLEDCGTTLCDAGYMEYSPDGKTWARLGATGAGTNWYDKNHSGNNVWSIQNYTRWHVTSIPLPANVDRLMLRFVMESDPFVTREGIAIDDIHIYDSVYSIYDGPSYTSIVSNQPAVSGNNWIDFVVEGKIMASVNANGQNMGSTDVQAFIDTGTVRINSGQYYHSRNIAIKPLTVNLVDSATVRFYFLDTETEKLINATGCDTCAKPTTAYELGVSKYSDVNDALENGDFADNNIGKWLFLNTDNVAIVPFDKGYYAEFRVKNFSEFWLTTIPINNAHSWPVDLLSFTATKQANNDVLVEWTAASEYYTAKYEVELARGNEEYRLNHFVKIGEVKSSGNIATQQDYQFIDFENQKSGVRYYRLKTIDHDGSFSYSVVRPVFFTNELQWQIYPNPSSGMFNLAYQVDEGETVSGKIFDLNGKLIGQVQFTGNAFIQKAEIDLSGPRFAVGLYFLQVKTGEKKQVFRLLKQ
ncbi:MAG TPA: T9SS type A sorting domain-containing protein, partial [Chitinophagaceae bacterium]|nr:T9SS type A sorting domain-containing protein [Chitinophagaceae bacterium]